MVGGIGLPSCLCPEVRRVPEPVLWCHFMKTTCCLTFKILNILCNIGITATVGTITEKSNDYFATRYWALKNVMIILLLNTRP
jgi:hypothetical protein